MMWCSKGGKAAVLLPTARFATGSSSSGSSNSGSSSSYGLWLSSLICNVHPAARLLEAPPGFLDGVPVRGPVAARGGGWGGVGGGGGGGGGWGWWWGWAVGVMVGVGVGVVGVVMGVVGVGWGGAADG